MARRNTNDGTAIGHQNVDNINRQIRYLAEDLFRRQRLTLTKDEFIQAFYLPEHLPVLREAVRLCGELNENKSMGFDFTLPGRRLSLSARFAEEFELPFPKYSRQGLVSSCPDELRDQFFYWAQHRVEQGDLAGDLIDAFTFLNKKLPDPRSLAVMLPCAPVLARKANVSETTILKMTKGPFSLVSLPPEVAQRMQMASAFIMNLTMLTPQAIPATECYIDRSTYGESNARSNIFNKSKEVPLRATIV